MQEKKIKKVPGSQAVELENDKMENVNGGVAVQDPRKDGNNVVRPDTEARK